MTPLTPPKSPSAASTSQSQPLFQQRRRVLSLSPTMTSFLLPTSSDNCRSFGHNNIDTPPKSIQERKEKLSKILQAAIDLVEDNDCFDMEDDNVNMDNNGNMRQ